jgi:hypothetical protein
MQDGYSMTSSPPFAARAPEEVEWYMGRDANAELPDSLDELRAQFERDGFLVFPGASTHLGQNVIACDEACVFADTERRMQLLHK